MLWSAGATSPPSTEMFTVQASCDASEHKERLRVVAATRAAQRGVDSSEQLVKDLLAGVVHGNDLVELLDLHPYNGDLAMSVCKLRTSGGLKCKLRYWMLEIPGKNGTSSAFAIKRQASQKTLQTANLSWLNVCCVKAMSPIVQSKVVASMKLHIG